MGAGAGAGAEASEAAEAAEAAEATEAAEASQGTVVVAVTMWVDGWVGDGAVEVSMMVVVGSGVWTRRVVRVRKVVSVSVSVGRQWARL